MADRKVVFAQNVQANATSLVQIINSLVALGKMYDNEGYGSAGADPIIDDDISELGITADELASVCNAVGDALNNFITRQAVGAGTYDKYLDAIRSI